MDGSLYGPLPTEARYKLALYYQQSISLKGNYDKPMKAVQTEK